MVPAAARARASPSCRTRRSAGASSTGSFTDAGKDLTDERLPPPAAPLHRRERRGQRGAAGADPHGGRGPRRDARPRSPWPGSSSGPRCTASPVVPIPGTRKPRPGRGERRGDRIELTRRGTGAAGADRGQGGRRPLRGHARSHQPDASRATATRETLELRQQLRLLRGELLVGHQAGLVQFPRWRMRSAMSAGSRRGGRRPGRLPRPRGRGPPPAPPPRTAATRARARSRARRRRSPDPGRAATGCGPVRCISRR